ncbi:hypothetical protein E3T55_18890 [Cryobacterium frigoriphilum]|uniref:Hydrolase n=1 Tax=Cryobacterium frigoriphilum TaxID=1259150 RepID=A0A4V3IQF2_9MICO|nr:HAD domain-containing protein [Cryobacterium frigoriphilum]TFD45398.1 hypothetical protein E3T55_18890 [Cryobacterium frigoriphilum]
MTPPRVLILLDVDGVLNPVAQHPRLVLSPARALLVQRLAALGDIVWATTWSPTHTFHLTRDLELPSATEGIAFPRDLHVDPRAPAPTPKLHWIARWLARQDEPPTAVVWIDDLLRPDAVDWAAAQPYPTLLVHPEPRVGLAPEHLDAVTAFVAAL